MRGSFRKTVLILSAGLIAAFVSSQEVGLSIMGLYQGSDLVVVARLRNNWTWRSSGIEFGVADLHVDRTLWGSALPGESLRLDWFNFGTCGSTNFTEHVGTPRIWFLTIPGSSDPTWEEPWWLRGYRQVSFNEPRTHRRVRTGGRQWVRTLDEEDSIAQVIRKPLLFLRSRQDRQTPRSAIRNSILDLIARNGSSVPVEVPLVQQEAGTLIAPQSVSLAIWAKNSDGNYTPRDLPIRHVPSSSIRLEPGQEFQTPLNVAQLYPLEPESTYCVDLTSPHAAPPEGFWRLVQTHERSNELPRVDPVVVRGARDWLTGR